MPNETKQTWIHIPAQLIIEFIGYPALEKEMLPSFCKHNPQLMSEAVQSIMAHDAEAHKLKVVPVATFNHAYKPDDQTVECLVMLEGNTLDIDRLIDYAQARSIDTLPAEAMEPTAYEAMKKSAFNLMRKNKIRNFSEEELHRVFKHAKEQLLYLSIVRSAIDDGLSIDSLYDEDREQGLSR